MQNGPREVPGASLGMPGGLSGASQKAVGTFFEARRRSMTILKRPRRVSYPILGSSRIPQIDQKWIFGRKDGLGERPRKRFSCCYVFFPAFCLIFVYFSMHFGCLFPCVFQFLRLFFSNRQIFKSIGRANILSTFCFFQFSVFFEICPKKIGQKMLIPK